MTARSAIGEIVEHAIYTRAELRDRLGWSDSAMRSAIASGLRAKRVGKSQVVYGGDFLEWVRSRPDVTSSLPQAAGETR
jgi:hypothetical protein